MCIICLGNAPITVLGPTTQCNYSLCQDCVDVVSLTSNNETPTAHCFRSCPLCATTGLKWLGHPSMLVSQESNDKKEKTKLSTVEEIKRKHQLLVARNESAAFQKVTKEAEKIFRKILKEIQIKCPYCQLNCSTAFRGLIDIPCKCGKAFCVFCLEDCDSSIHQAIRKNHHGKLDKHTFDAERQTHLTRIVQCNLRKLENESQLLFYLVKNHIQNSGLILNAIPAKTSAQCIQIFLERAKGELTAAVLNDRLSLLKVPGGKSQPLKQWMMSPRHSIPSGYQVRVRISNNHWHLSVHKKNLDKQKIKEQKEEEEEEGEEKWAKVSFDQLKSSPLTESLTSLLLSFGCAVIAIANAPCLYQTITYAEGKTKFHPVESNGGIADESDLEGAFIVLGINPNKRILDLQAHVRNTPDANLMLDPIQHLIGAAHPKALVSVINGPIPKSILELNEHQLSVAHPLRVQSAMEVAGPPGTGKTKTITELTRSLLACTPYKIIVLSERNGAIDAIAQKFANESLEFSGNRDFIPENIQIKERKMWENVLTFGSSGMGPYSSLFSINKKAE